MTKRQVCKILVILLGLVLTQSTFGQSGAESSAFSYGQAKSKEPQQPFYQYVVKFVCGKSDGQILSRGDYRTAINLHNPHPDSIGYSWKVAVAFPGQVGPVSKFVNAALGPDEALEIDCRQIYQRIEGKPGFLKGFVVIESKVELDVVSVYTAAGATGEVETMDIERVSPRHFAGCPDLVIEKIDRPDWDAANHRSVIRATVRNIGTAPANPTFARVIDPTTFQPLGSTL